MEPKESGPVKEILEVPEANVADGLVDAAHEGRDGAVREVQDLGYCRQLGVVVHDLGGA